MRRSAATWVAAAGVGAVCVVLWAVSAGRRERPGELAPATQATVGAEEGSPVASAGTAPPTQASVSTGAVPSGIASSSAEADEATVMTQLRSLVEADASAALEMARAADQRFPGSDAAAERAMIEVKSLAREGKLSEARGAAEQMVNRYPGTPWALEVERHTGAHPRVNH